MSRPRRARRRHIEKLIRRRLRRRCSRPRHRCWRAQPASAAGSAASPSTPVHPLEHGGSLCRPRSHARGMPWLNSRAHRSAPVRRPPTVSAVPPSAWRRATPPARPASTPRAGRCAVTPKWTVSAIRAPRALAGELTSSRVSGTLHGHAALRARRPLRRGAAGQRLGTGERVRHRRNDFQRARRRGWALQLRPGRPAFLSAPSSSRRAARRRRSTSSAARPASAASSSTAQRVTKRSEPVPSTLPGRRSTSS